MKKAWVICRDYGYERLAEPFYVFLDFETAVKWEEDFNRMAPISKIRVIEAKLI